MELSGNKKIVVNSLFSAISRGSEVIFLIVLILAARYLGDEDFGKFSFALSLTAMFTFVTDIGLKTLLVREISRDKSQVHIFIGNALTLKIGLSILAVGILVVLAVVMELSGEVRIVLGLLALSMVSKSFKMLFRVVIIAEERFELETYVVAIERAILIILSSFVLISGYGLIPFAITFFLVNVLNLGVTIYLVQKNICVLKCLLDFSVMKRLSKAAIPFCLTAGAFSLYFRLDSVMLSVISGDAEVGWYNAAYRIVEGLSVIPMILYSVLFPRLSVLHQESKKSVEKLIQRACKYLIFFAVPITFFGIIAGEEIISLVYGDEYFTAILAWQILLVGVIFMYLWNIFVVLLNAIDLQRVPFVGVLIGSLINTVLNLFLIPRYGHIGASISTVISEIVLFSYLLFALYRVEYRFTLIKYFAKPVIAMSLSLGFVFFMSNINMLLVLLVGACSYFIALLFLKFFDSEEVRLYRELSSSLKLRFFKSVA